MILFTEQKAFIDVFEKTVGAEEYSYWNGSDDQLKYLTEEQWDERKDTWNEILANSSAPDLNGATFVVVKPVRYLPNGWR